MLFHRQIPDRDLENRRINQRIDPVTNKIYTKDVYDPAPPVVPEETQAKDDDENADGDDEQGEEEEFSDVDTEDDDDDESKVQVMIFTLWWM